jgi:hypothetical protein
LIGALEQLRIIGVGEFMPDSSRDYLNARANFCKLFQGCILHASGELNSDQWDFILCNTVEWLNDIAEAVDETITSKHLVLMNALLRLLKSVGQFLNSPSARTDPSIPTDLLTTWTEFFMPEIAKNVFTLIIKFKEEDELLENLTWMNIYDVTAFIGLDCLLKMEVPLSLSLDLKCPDNVNSLFNHFYKNLKSSSQINATISTGFIKMLLSQIVEKDGKEPPVYILNQTEKLLSNENQIHSAVLAVDICLELICLNSGYLYYFLGSSECSSLLDMIWSLLPGRQIDEAVDLKCISSNFVNLQDWSISGLNRIADVCPGAIRYWMKSLSNKNLQKEIQLFCQNYLSETLIKKELKNVKISGISCVPYIKTRSLLATYIMDDLHIEIMITLPVDWPLSPVNIEGLRSVGVNGSEWRLWLFQLEQSLATGSGLAAGLTKWSYNLKKKFDNLEECYICYSIIYGKARALRHPSLTV